MYNVIRVSLLVIAGFMFLKAMPQNDTLMLQSVEIKSSPIEKISGLKKTRIDSLTRQMNKEEDLSGVLARHTPVFIKSYGQGMLATSSFRGSGASHTQVLWNGMSLNSPMLGQVDFSTLPVFFADNISLYHGGSSLALNSGALGGSISIENTPDWAGSGSLAFSQHIGSFESYSSLLSISLKEEKFISRTRLLSRSSGNNFTFKNIAASRENPPTENRQNAAFKQYGLLQEIYYRSRSQGTFSFKSWWQDYHREIPTPLLVTPFEQNQVTRSLRNLGQWDLEKNTTKWQARLGYQYDQMNYFNGLLDETSLNTVRSLFSDVNVKKTLKKIRINAGLRHEYHQVESDNYLSDKNRDKTSLMLGATYLPSHRFSGFVQLRQDYADNDFLPLIPSLGFDALLFQDYKLYFKANVSRNYHLPSLNDLYWSPNGNPDLLPEEGYSGETGVTIKDLKFDNLIINTEITGFYSIINDWIHWKPDEIYSYWRPSNLKKVNSKGIEAAVKLDLTLGDFQLNYSGGYTYTLTENSEAVVQHDASVGKQLIYVPRHMHHSMLRIDRGDLFVSIGAHYTGRRYTASDNTRYMPSYWLTDLTLGWNPQWAGKQLRIQADITNLANTHYQAVAWHPMPGRSFHIKAGLTINNLDQ